MKKIVIFIGLAIAALAVLPIIGNKFVAGTIKLKVANLEQFGLGVEKSSSESSYLSSKKHFEFLLKDADKFAEYLNKYSDKQIPMYVNAALEGVLIGVDIQYSNIPFTKAISIDIYPLALSPKMAEDIQKNDKNVYTHIKNILKSKGILYHINYNVASENFDGYLKDVDESFHLKNGAQLQFKLQKANYKGNGGLIAPKMLIANIKTIDLSIVDTNGKMNFTLSSLHTSSNFNSHTTYVSSASLGSLEMNIMSKRENVTVSAKDMQANASENDQGEKAEFNAKSSIKSLAIQSNKGRADFKDFSYDIALNGLDKQVLDKIRVLALKADANRNRQIQEAIQKSIIELFSQGMQIKIADLSLQKALLNNKEDLGGFDVKMDVNVKKDPALASKIQTSPMLLAQNVDMTLHLKLSEPMYAKFTQNQPMAKMLQQFIKKDGDKIIFDILFKDAALTVNGKALR